MNHERQQRNIQIKMNSIWIPASDEMTEMRNLKMVYTQYKNKPTYHQELPYSQDGIKIYRDENNHYNPTYALHSQGIRGESVPIPIELKMNPHPLDKYRANCPLARLRLFKSIYHIKKGDGMYWHSDTIW